LLGLLVTETSAPKDKLVSVLHYSGEPLTFRFVYSAVREAGTLRKTA
jgi:2-oxoglutarate/2-oxoacid ferredoxin oxidoreductase subunit alpha